MTRPTASSQGRSEPDQELDRLAHEVIGAAIEVHRVLGPGFLESTYEHAIQIELRSRGMVAETQVPVGVEYKGQIVGEGRADLVVENRLIVELKTVDELSPIHRAQLISYLKATGKSLGLLINFNVTMLRDGIKRVIQS